MLILTVISIVLYLLGCYMHYHFTHKFAIKDGIDLLCELTAMFFWPFSATYYFFDFLLNKFINGE